MESFFNGNQLKNQKLFELVKIFREKISAFDTSKHKKNANKALELRTKGNDLFSKGLYDDAIQVYTEVGIIEWMSKSNLFYRAVSMHLWMARVMSSLSVLQTDRLPSFTSKNTRNPFKTSILPSHTDTLQSLGLN